MNPDMLRNAAWMYAKVSDGTFITSHFSAVLKDKVDGKILRNAVDTASRRFPYLMKEVCKNESRLYLVDNPRPVVIKEGSTVRLCSEESNRHLIAITYSGKKNSFISHHGLVDGRGIMPFRSTVLYYECREKYDSTLEAPAQTRLYGTEIMPSEYEDPYEFAKELAGYNEIQVHPALPENMYNICRDEKLERTGYHCYTYAVDSAAFMAVCKKYGGTPNTMTALLMGKIFHDRKTREDSVVIPEIYCDLRGTIGKNNGHWTCVSTIQMPSYESTMNLSFEEQNAKVRGELKKGAGEESMKKMIKEWGEMGNYIEAIYIAVNTDYQMLIEFNALHDKFFFTFVQHFDMEVYINDFMKVLEENSIPVKLIDRWEDESGRMDIVI